MTVTAGTTNRASEVGNGVKVAFDFSFRIFAASELEVFKVVTATGAQTLQTITTDYSVAINGIDNSLSVPGGTVTYVVAPLSTETSLIISDYTFDQQTDIPTASNIPEEALEDGFDKLTLIAIQINEILGRAATLPEASTLTALTLPLPTANKALLWNGSANALINSTDDFNDIVTNATTQANNASASASAASSSASAAATSESNAATSASNAATSETNAAASAVIAQNAEAAVAAVAPAWNFDSSTSVADPGTGDIRFNNATLSSVTEIAISALSGETGNPDLSDFIVTWDDSTNALRGSLIIRERASAADFVVFNITGAITDNTTWLQIPVAHVASSGSFANTDPLFVGFDRAGDAGSLTAVVNDTTPQLGGNLDVNGNEIQSVSGDNIEIHSDNDVNITLGDAAGVDDLNIKDSGGSTVMTVTSDGNISTFGGQLAFPATQNASSDSNTLDDYEEGTFTPEVTFATPGDLSVTYSIQGGRYTKIGRLVTIQITIVTSVFTHTTASGNMQITGLPFAHAAGTPNSVGATFVSRINKTNFTQHTGSIGGGTSIIEILSFGNNQATSTVSAADSVSGSTFRFDFNCSYPV